MRARFGCVLRSVRSVRPSLGAGQFAIVPAVLGGLCGALLPASESHAACAPATGNNITVTCSGTTQDQGPGTNTGYGDSTQNGVTVNVQSGASVLGTSTGIDLNNNNIINNLGTVTTDGTGIGNVYGINTNGPLTVTNSGTIGRTDPLNPGNNDLAGINTNGTGLIVTNTSTGVIQGSVGIFAGGTPSVMTVFNSGLVSGLVGGGGFGISGDTVNLTNNATGTITADAAGVQANTATIYNYGTISAPPPPVGAGGGTAINVNTLTLVNYASGVITGDGGGISGSFVPVLTVTNFGTISGTGLGASGIQGNTVFLTNSGTVSGGSGGSAISMDHGTIINNVGGSIAGDFDTIAAFHNTSVFNAGTITSISGPAIFFTAGGGGNTVTIAPTSIIMGNVVASGADTFQLGGTGTGTFNLALIGAAQQYQGFSTFNKVDASTWTLTGAGNQAWTVAAGTLLVNGSLSAASGITVGPSGTLGGTGTLPTTNVNGGVLAPGLGNGPGAIAVAGNLNFQPASTYLVNIAQSTASTANVSGSAALAGTVQAVFQPGGPLSRQYTILTANGGLGGSTFSNLVINESGFAGSLSYTPTTVMLGLTAQLGSGGTLNQNQRNVANAINGFFNSGGALPPGFFNLFNLASPALGTALSQLSGQAATGSQQAAFQLMDQFLAFTIDPFVDGQGDSGAGGRPMGFAAEEPVLPSDVELAYASVLKAPPRMFEQRWSVRGAAYGGYDRTNGDPGGLGTNDLSSRAGGFAGAIDYHVTRDSVIGVALAGGETNWGLAGGLGGGRSNAMQAGVYGATRNGPAYLAGSLAYTWHAASTDRFAFAGDELTARFNAQSYGGRLESGYRLAWPMGAVTPYAAIQAQSFSTPSYQEVDVSGGGFGLAFAGRTATDTRSELGARFDRAVAIDPNSVLTLRTRLAWAHDWVSDPTLAAIFEMLPGAGFTVDGAVPAKDSALATAGAELTFVNGVSLLGKFDGAFASHAQAYTGSVVLRYVW